MNPAYRREGFEATRELDTSNDLLVKKPTVEE